MASNRSQGDGKFIKKPVTASNKGEYECECVEKPLKAFQSNKGGYECEFVEKPPKAFQSDCPVCLLVLREPFQVTCCGYAFCRVCIERIKKDNKPCPCCNFEDFDKFEDKRLKRSLYEFKVYCINKQQGCKWEGELRELDNHLNSNPGQQNQLDGCQFMKINCIHCAELFLRSDIRLHQETACLKRPFSCEYCNEFDSTHEDVTINHWPLCGCFPVPCTNECGEIIERQNLETHIADHCPETIIDCDFEYAGCDVKSPRKDMPTHIKERAVEHLSLHAKNYKAVVDNLKEENEQLKQAVAKLTRDLRLQQICTPICPAAFIMNDFQQHKIDDNVWYSSPFYTHPQGYKMCLTVTPNSFDEYHHTHTAVGICLMKGEFDNQLKWPLRSHITIRLFSQVDNEYKETKLSYTGTEGDYDTMANRAPTEEEDDDYEELADGGPACIDFISHTELQPKYLKNNCLQLCAHQYEPLDQ